MIISASYKTDIPAFYGRWMMNRLAAGFCCMTNPFNRAQVIRVELAPHDVDGIIFWTKNVGPFLSSLPEVRSRGFPFVVQYSINGYPRTLECSVVDWRKSVDHMHWLAERFGPGVGVWRYDPIVFSSITPPEFHLDSFERIAKALKGTTDEVVVSFAQIYKKTKRNMEKASTEENFTWWDPPEDEKRDLLYKMTRIAASNKFQLTICSQPEFLVDGVLEARCIDVLRLVRVYGIDLHTRTKGNRPGCLCAESRDIGDYDTCPHGCVYCYAVSSRATAQKRFREHDPDSPFLFPPKGEVSIPPPKAAARRPSQMGLF